MRLIDADELYQKLHEAGGCDASKGSWADGWDKAIDEAIRMVAEAPTVEAAPVVHGEWVDNSIPESMLSECSVCGYSCGAYSFNYCPNYGAKMGGEQNE